MKITKIKIVYTMLVGLCVFATCNDSCLPEQTGSPGFPVDTNFVVVDEAGNYYGGGPVPGQAVSGTWLSDNSGAVGTIYQFAAATDNDGTYLVSNARIPANWSLQVLWNPPCVEQTSASRIVPMDALGWEWTCEVIVTPEVAQNESTHFVLPGAIPSTITSYGDFSPPTAALNSGSTPVGPRQDWSLALPRSAWSPE